MKDITVEKVVTTLLRLYGAWEEPQMVSPWNTLYTILRYQPSYRRKESDILSH